MMTSIYALFPGTLPGFQALKKVLSPDYKVILVDKVESLVEHAQEKGVVLLGGDPTRLQTMITLIRNTAPRLSCVFLVDAEQQSQLTKDMVQQADILCMPASELEIHARLNAAAHLSELRYLIDTSAQMDEATGLYNQYFFMKRLGEEMSLAKRHLSPVTCVLLSIAYYDVYMDSYGYGFITELLQQVSGILKEQLRQEDIAARLDNSEIALLLPHSTERGALMLTQRLVQEIEKQSIHVGDQVEHLSLSAGMVGYPTLDEAELDPDTLIRYGRHALHAARCSETQKIILFGEMKPTLR